MTFKRPSALLAGFHADQPLPSIPQIVHLGEQWTPSHYRIPDHTHPVWEFYFQVEGESNWKVGGEPVALAGGSLLAAPPGMRHHLLTPTRREHHFYFAAIDAPACFPKDTALHRLWVKRTRPIARQAPQIALPFRQLVHEVASQEAYRTRAVRAALDYLLIEISRTIPRRVRKPSLVFRHPAVAFAQELLSDQPTRKWTLAQVASECGLSASRLAALFQKETGESLHQYLMKCRRETAVSWLIHTDMPITQLALELGYASSQHFASSIRKATGKSPSQIREQRKA